MNGEKGFGRDLDNDDDLPVQKFVVGELGEVMKTGLKDLVNHYVTDPVKRDSSIKFIEWIPGDHLEGFLVRCMDYGAERTKPGSGPKPTRRARAAGGQGGAQTPG